MGLKEVCNILYSNTNIYYKYIEKDSYVTHQISTVYIASAFDSEIAHIIILIKRHILSFKCISQESHRLIDSDTYDYRNFKKI